MAFTATNTNFVVRSFAKTSNMIVAQMPLSQSPFHIQRLIHYDTLKYQNIEPKCNRSQPYHLEPESVVRTRTCQGYNLKRLVLPYHLGFWLSSSLIQQNFLRFCSLFSLLFTDKIHESSAYHYIVFFSRT